MFGTKNLDAAYIFVAKTRQYANMLVLDPKCTRRSLIYYQISTVYIMKHNSNLVCISSLKKLSKNSYFETYSSINFIYNYET